jgi:hypothetical protein
LPHKNISRACCVAVIVFGVAIHQVDHPTREKMLIGWTLVAIPAACVAAALGRTYGYLSLTMFLVSLWFGLRYCDDMGGGYSHSLTAGFLIMATLAAAPIATLACLLRYFHGRRA